MARQGVVTVLQNQTNTRKFHDSALGNVRRFWQYFAFPLRYLVSPARPKGTVVVAWQQFFGINLAFWTKLLRRPKRSPLVVMTFIYNPKRGILGKIYKKYVKYSLSGGYVDKVLCYSAHECDMYAQTLGLPRSLFAGVRLGLDTTAMTKPAKVTRGNYIFATGRSNRDYDLLVSELGQQYDIVIACPGYKVPSNCRDARVKVLDNCFGADMIEVMSGSFAVAVPLKSPDISSGQLVILQAMSMGKPVIVSENKTVAEYVDNGRTGIIVPCQPGAMLQAVQRLEQDSALYGRLAANSRRAFQSRFTETSLATSVANIVAKL